MNKVERHQKIKNIIQNDHLATQDELKQVLLREGITVTQATLSRDLREIGLLKVRDKDGKLYYRLSDLIPVTLGYSIKNHIKKISRASFILVLQTRLGEADVLANIIDADPIPDILGTVAGADTLLVICKNEEAARMIEEHLI